MRVERIAIVATAADLPFRERREESVVERGVHEADFPRARRWPRGRREDVSSPGFWPREETGIDVCTPHFRDQNGDIVLDTPASREVGLLRYRRSRAAASASYFSPAAILQAMAGTGSWSTLKKTLARKTACELARIDFQNAYCHGWSDRYVRRSRHRSSVSTASKRLFHCQAVRCAAISDPNRRPTVGIAVRP
jgi:hypothetical protein